MNFWKDPCVCVSYMVDGPDWILSCAGVVRRVRLVPQPRLGHIWKCMHSCCVFCSVLFFSGPDDTQTIALQVPNRVRQDWMPPHCLEPEETSQTN